MEREYQKRDILLDVSFFVYQNHALDVSAQ